MSANRDPDRLIKAFLEEVVDELPDRAYDAVRAATEQTRQRVVIGPWREEQMTRFAVFVTAAAAIGLAVVVGLRFLPSDGGVGVGGQPTASPSVEPTAPSSPSATLVSDPEGALAPGTYAIHPLAMVRRSIAEPNESLTVTFTVPDGWQFVSNVLAPAAEPGVGPPGGVSIQFFDVYTLNGDSCLEGDVISVGPTADDLVEALGAQTAYEVSEPVDVTIGGYSGTRLDIVQPTSGCMWTATSIGIVDDVYAHGPGNRWQTNILDVDGTRLVIAATDFPGTAPADRAEMDAILESILIEP